MRLGVPTSDLTQAGCDLGVAKLTPSGINPIATNELTKKTASSRLVYLKGL